MSVTPVKKTQITKMHVYIFDNLKRYYIKRANSTRMCQKQTDSKCVVLGVRIIYILYYLHVLYHYVKML